MNKKVNIKVTTTDVKNYNRNRIFREIYNSGQISRQAIADNLGLSLPTVNQNLKLLAEMNLISIDGSFNSTGGRKAQAIEVNNTAKVVVSINIEPAGYHISVVGLKGDTLKEISVNKPFKPDKKYAEAVYKSFRDLIKRLDGENKKSKERISEENILGTGITIPGIFDKEKNVITFAPTLNVHNYDMSLITDYFKENCIVMNDASAHAYADYFFAGGKDASRRIYLMLGDGVGGAIITREGIMTGLHNRSGEFGHMTIHPDGKICTCGKRGCLEAYVSERKLSSDFLVTLEEFFEVLDNGKSKEYKDAFETYLDDLAIAVNNLYCVFDAEIVIGGTVAKYLKKYEQEIKRRLSERYAFDTDGEYLSFACCNDSQAKAGAALLHLQNFIESV